jgi:uncharacterized phage-associated protein
MRTFASKAIANHFLELSRADGKELCRTELLNLVLLANQWYARAQGSPLVSGEINNGNRGTIPDLYNEFIRFGEGPITGFAREWYAKNGRTGIAEPRLSAYPNSPQKTFTLALLDRIWRIYQDDLSASKLCSLGSESGAIDKFIENCDSERQILKRKSKPRKCS